MKYFICLLFSLIALSACDSRKVTVRSGSGGASASSSPRLINGDLVDVATSPQFVQVFIFDGVSAEPAICSGTVVGPTSIMTAAHCVTSPSAKITVQAGEKFLPVLKVAIPETYREDQTLGAIFDDVAILSTPPLGLPALPIVTSITAPVDGSYSTYGFGLDENGEVGILKSGPTLVATITPNHFFSVFDGDGAESCFGDSGGPLVMFYTDLLTKQLAAGVVAIVSTGSKIDCTSGDLTLFTNLQNPGLIEFIQRNAPGVAIL